MDGSCGSLSGCRLMLSLLVPRSFSQPTRVLSTGVQFRYLQFCNKGRAATCCLHSFKLTPTPYPVYVLVSLQSRAEQKQSCRIYFILSFFQRLHLSIFYLSTLIKSRVFLNTFYLFRTLPTFIPTVRSKPDLMV